MENCAAPRSRNSSLHRLSCSRSSFFSLSSSILAALKERHHCQRFSLSQVKAEDVEFVREFIAKRSGAGRAPALSRDDEQRVFDRLKDFQLQAGFMCRNLVHAELLCEAARPHGEAEQRSTAEHHSGIRERAKMLGRHAVSGFLERWGFKVSSARPLTEERQMQYQPEIAAEWGHLFLHTQMVVMIANALGRGEVVDGWGCEPGKLPCRTDGGADFRDDDLTIDDDGDVFVPVLGAKLEPIDNDLLFALDEVPMPTRLASTNTLTYSVEALCELAQLPNVHVTVTPLTSRSKGLLALQVLSPLKVNAQDFPAHSNPEDRVIPVLFSEQQKGFQTNETMKELVLWLQKLRLPTSNTSWGILLLDGYGAHLSRDVCNALAQLNIIGLVEPAQSSTWSQSGDQGGNHAGHANYRVDNAAALGRVRVRHTRMTHCEQLDLLVTAFCRVPSDVWKVGYSHVGFTAGTLIDFQRAFKASLWAPGLLFRKDLPEVTQRLCNSLFSLQNLIRHWGSPMLVADVCDSQAVVMQIEKAKALIGVPPGESAALYMLKVSHESARKLYEGKWEKNRSNDAEGDAEDDSEGDLRGEDDAESGAEDEGQQAAAAPASHCGINTRKGLAFWAQTTAADMSRIAAAREKKVAATAARRAKVREEAFLRLKFVEAGWLQEAERDKPSAITVSLLDRVFKVNAASLALNAASWSRKKKDEKIALLQMAIEQQRVQLKKE